jgi:hypothetical protein
LAELYKEAREPSLSLDMRADSLSFDMPSVSMDMRAADNFFGRRYSVYLLYWYSSTKKTDAAAQWGCFTTGTSLFFFLV